MKEDTASNGVGGAAAATASHRWPAAKWVDNGQWSETLHSATVWRRAAAALEVVGDLSWNGASDDTARQSCPAQ